MAFFDELTKKAKDVANLAADKAKDAAELEGLRRSQHVFTPQRDAQACGADYARWRRAVERASGWIENDV